MITPQHNALDPISHAGLCLCASLHVDFPAHALLTFQPVIVRHVSLLAVVSKLHQRTGDRPCDAVLGLYT